MAAKKKTIENRASAIMASDWMTKVKKKHGDNIVEVASEAHSMEVMRIPTGIFSLDYALGGGFPAGRVNTVYGAKSCLAPDTFIPYQIRNTVGGRQNCKGGSLERLYECFNSLPPSGDGRGKYSREETVGCEYFAPSVDEDGRVFMNQIVGVVSTGDHECFELQVSSGETIVATANHKFFTGSGYTALADLSVGDLVTISRREKPTEAEAKHASRPCIYVKWHPVAGITSVTPNDRTRNVRTYTYHRLSRSRAVVEASMNGLTLEQYVCLLNDGVAKDLRFLSTDEHVHHVDENYLNDDLSNLRVIDAQSHGELHAREKKLGLGFAHLRKIESIRSVGFLPTFDVQMAAPYNNFVADGFIVHNSAKTTTLLKAIGQAQTLCAICFTPTEGGCKCGEDRDAVAAFIDIEGCVAEDTRFLDSTSGQVFTAREVFEDKIPLVTRSYNHDTGRMEQREISAWFDNGVKETVTVRTTNSEISVTPNHKLLVKRTQGAEPEWVRSDQIEEGWLLASPNVDVEGTWPVDGVAPGLARLAGYMIGDGSYGPSNTSPVFTNVDPAVIADFTELVREIDCEVVPLDDRHYRVRGVDKGSKWHPNPLTERMRAWGMTDQSGGQKTIPPELFTGSSESVLALLSGLYLSDGHVSKGRPTLGFSNTSLKLIEQIRELWLRLGVPSTVSVMKMYAAHHAQQYNLVINGVSALKRVHAMMPLFGYKGDQLSHWASQPPALVRGYSVDRVNGPLLWFKIREVFDSGLVQTYDFTVLGTHNYVANGIVAHNTFEKKWAEAHGVQMDRLLISRPEYAEQGLDIAEAMLRSNECDILVIDSIAFLTAMKEIEESTEKDLVGTQARLLGKGIRKFVSALNQMANENQGRKPTIFLVNQIRMKVGLLFGCFHADTPVMFADGSQHRILDVVRNRLEGPVLSWDGKRIVERKIVNWFNNGLLPEGEQWLTFRVAGTGGQRGAQGFTCTRNHVLVNGGGKEIQAGEVRVGDSLLSWSEEKLSPTDLEVVVGSLFGDGHITKRGAFSLSNQEQPEYLTWKKSFIQAHGFTRVDGSGRVAWRTPNEFEFRRLREEFYTEGAREPGCRSIPLGRLKAAGPLTLAVWFADDGTYKETHKNASISVKRLTDEYATRVAAVLAIRYPGVKYSNTQQALIFSVDTFKLFSEAIAPYTPACMQYKLLPEHREIAGRKLAPENYVHRRIPVATRVLSIKESKKKNRWRTQFDLQIEGDSFYLVGGDSRGVVVHNSPETQPGGMAPGFAASTETKFWSGKYKIDDDAKKTMSAEMNFRVEKNKCLRGSETIFLPEEGRSLTVEELARRGRGATVFSEDTEGRIVPALMDKCWRQPTEEEVFELELSGGERVGANREHRFRAPEGWVFVKDLKVGDWLGVPRKVTFAPLPMPGWCTEKSLLLGLLIGDGCVTGDTGVYLINTDPMVVREAEAAVKKFECELYLKPGSSMNWGIRQKDGGHKGQVNLLYSWLREVGIWGCRAWEKVLPPEVFHLSDPHRGMLIGALLVTDGWVRSDRSNRVGFRSTSKDLVEQLKYLLLSFGVYARVRLKEPGLGGKIEGRQVRGRRPSWELVISGRQNLKALLQAVPWMGSKRDLLKVEMGSWSDLTDVIPDPLFRLESYVRAGTTRASELATALGFANSKDESWERVLRRRRSHISRRSLFAWLSCEDSEHPQIQRIVESDLAWSRVVRITSQGVQPVYDVSVPGYENLVVSGVVAHNTAAARMEGSFTLVLAETATKKIGAVYDEDFLISMGEKIGLIERKGVIWHVLGKEFRKKEDMETALLTDKPFAAEMRKVLMQVLLST